ncbi:hypothetical protein ACFWMJ_37220 [Streptomyces hawaiiensis]|uniref:hypothetical protein n=1 Tax=Streptomyces hawaiiensis TaxID=67305 RepID=UPI003657D991
MTLRDQDDEVVDAELVEDGELVRAAPAARPLVDAHTVLMPDEEIPTSDDPRTTYTERTDLERSPPRSRTAHTRCRNDEVPLAQVRRGHGPLGRAGQRPAPAPGRSGA